MSLQSALDELLARHNGDVLPITVHVLRNPTRLALLCADGNRREYRITDVGATTMASPSEAPLRSAYSEQAEGMRRINAGVTATVDEPTPDGPPPPIRIDVQGFQDAMFYGRPAGEA